MTIYEEPGVVIHQLSLLSHLCQRFPNNKDVGVLPADLKFVQLLVTYVVGHILHDEQDHRPKNRAKIETLLYMFISVKNSLWFIVDIPRFEHSFAESLQGFVFRNLRLAFHSGVFTNL